MDIKGNFQGRTDVGRAPANLRTFSDSKQLSVDELSVWHTQEPHPATLTSGQDLVPTLPVGACRGAV